MLQQPSQIIKLGSDDTKKKIQRLDKENINEIFLIKLSKPVKLKVSVCAADQSNSAPSITLEHIQQPLQRNGYGSSNPTKATPIKAGHVLGKASPLGGLSRLNSEAKILKPSLLNRIGADISAQELRRKKRAMDESAVKAIITNYPGGRNLTD